MGTALLKRKMEVNYRKAQKTDEKNCGNCGHCLMTAIYGIGSSEVRSEELRCPVIGWGNSRRYSLNPKNVCDCWRGK